jgi:hypothetical protein
MNNYNEFSKDMQRLIDRTIMGSIDFCMDMMQDSEEDEVTNLKQFREMVYSQAIYFMQNELDPEYADIVIPARLLEAINERTINAVHISFEFKGGV